MDGLTWFGLMAVTAMLLFYALEDRSAWFVLAFAGACALGFGLRLPAGRMAVRRGRGGLEHRRAAPIHGTTCICERRLISWREIVRAIGLMSGTSMDGVDVALIDSDGERHFVVGSVSLPALQRQASAPCCGRDWPMRVAIVAAHRAARRTGRCRAPDHGRTCGSGRGVSDHAQDRARKHRCDRLSRPDCAASAGTAPDCADRRWRVPGEGGEDSRGVRLACSRCCGGRAGRAAGAGVSSRARARAGRRRTDLFREYRRRRQHHLHGRRQAARSPAIPGPATRCSTTSC